MSSFQNGNSSNFTTYNNNNNNSMGNSRYTPSAAAYARYNSAASMIQSDDEDDRYYNRHQRNTTSFYNDYDDYHHDPTRYSSSLRAEYEEQYLYQYHRPMDEYARPMVSSVSVERLVNQSPIKWSGDESEKIQYASRKRLSDAELPAFVSGATSVSSSYCSDRKMKAGKMIEVSPGQFLRLRGAEETWKAIHQDFFMPCGCLCCNITIFCIQDADCVLCPICKTINPMDYANGDGEGGVGLGFTMEDLKRWQDEIDCGRKMNSKNKHFC
jgi:hypothetical protein